MALCSRYHKEITAMNKKIHLSAISLLMVASSITNTTDDVNDLCNKSDVITMLNAFHKRMMAFNGMN